MRSSKLTLLICTLICTNLFAQIDFKTYRTLESVGQMSADFSSNTFDKVSTDLSSGQDNLSVAQEKVFFQSIHYGIDDILHSGLVVYGDEVSRYVQSIAEKLLQNKPDLLSKLRFYTLKSNETNAFSTDQGIIFVTTGLISRLANEAQLAFVLAHEISHYTERHVIDAFKFRTEIRERNRNIRSLSIYSKQKEFDADAFGAEIYYAAGYAREGMNSALTLLGYVHLPFEELALPRTYLGSTRMQLPDSLFPRERFEITELSDEFDSLSSHPNIKDRINQLTKIFENYSEWGDELNYFGEDRFKMIRAICRFESVRNDLLTQNYIDAVYSIHVLEQDFPSSDFLSQLKAQAWLGISQLASQGNLDQITRSDENLQGEIATLHLLISKFSKMELAAISLRQIYDLHVTNLTDVHIASVYDFMIREIATEPKIDLISESDSLNFALAGVSDILTNSDFLEKYNYYKSDEELTHMELVDIEGGEDFSGNENMNLGIKRLIVVEPTVHSYKRQSFDLIKSEKLKENFSEVTDYAGSLSPIEITVIDRDNLSKNGTPAFNERNILFNYMTQMGSSSQKNVFPVDYHQLAEIRLKYNTSKVMLIRADQWSRPILLPSILILPLYPIASVAIPLMILKRNKTNLHMAILDLEQNNLEVALIYSFNEAPKKYNLGAHLFSIFNNLSKERAILNNTEQ